MKAIRLATIARPLRLDDVAIPEPGPGDILVRVKAAGICHSDAHYRKGTSSVAHLPITLGHEVAGVVEKLGSEVHGFNIGDRVCLHYLATCGHCRYCLEGNEQFCPEAKMIGKHRDGGFAEFIVMPARSIFKLPDSIPFEQGAVMMCSSATSLHALKQARLREGETVAVFGIGGLGLSAVQLAKSLGAAEVFGVDINASKLKLANEFGAIPVNAKESDPIKMLSDLTGGRGVDVSLELIGLPITMQQAVRSLAVRGRAALAGITQQSFHVSPYHELINKEAEIIGVSDHLASELPLLIKLVKDGKLDLSRIVSQKIGLDADSINKVLDALERFDHDGRAVITLA